MSDNCLNLDKINENFSLNFDGYRVEAKLTNEGVILDVFDVSRGIENAEEVTSTYEFWGTMDSADWCKF